MGVINFIKRGVKELMIARPDEAKEYAIYKHPDQTIPNNAQLTVDSDEIAIFFKDGKVEGKIPPGRHTLNSSNIPFLSNMVDSFTGANVFIAEVFFVSVRQFTGIKFGGRIGSVEDPKSGVPVETMVHGEFALQITNPEALILGLTGMRQADNESFFSWFKQQVLKVIRDQTAELIVKKNWPLLDVVSGAYTEEIEETVLLGVRKYVEHYGVVITQLGNFVLGLKEEDEKRLKDLYTDAAYVRMAGGMQGFQQFSAGKAMMGAGEGMSQGGGSGGEGGNSMLGGAALGVGFGMANMFSNNTQAAATSQQTPSNQSQGKLEGQASAMVTCPGCKKTVSQGKFCLDCGTPLAQAGPKFCANCGIAVPDGGKFCSGCGTKVE
jgi:membrane protease subunit (stomatin/prohibitin family)